MNNFEREQEIKRLCGRFVSAKTKAGRVMYWEQMRDLINSRPVVFVEQMERNKGLR